MSVIGVSKTTFKLCDGVIPRKMRIVRIGGVDFRQYHEISTGLYCLELICDPSRSSGWCKREYKTINWGLQYVIDHSEGGVA